MIQPSTLKRSSITFTALFLAACGGGSSSGTNSPSPAPAPAPAPIPSPAPTPSPTSNLQTIVPPPTYAAGSQQLAAFTALNEFRSSMGLGLWAQDAKIDVAAANHLNYLISNGVFSHGEDPAQAGYTGDTATDRGAYAGYSGSLGEVLAGGGSHGGSVGVKVLIGTIYHRQGLMSQGAKDVGIAYGADIGGTLVINYGMKDSGQFNAGNFVGIYPASGQTDVPRFMQSESPNPFPDLDPMSADYPTKTGYPVSIIVKEGQTLTVSSFTITEAGQSTALPTRLVTGTGDPAVMQSSAWLVARAPLKASTVYDVSFAGEVSGTAMNRNWSFTTTACDVYQSYTGC